MIFLRARSVLCLALFAFAVPASTSLADCPGDQNPGGIWKQSPIPLVLNPSLDPRLERGVQVIVQGQPVLYVLGDAGTRFDCVKQAAADWNAALKDLCGQGKTPVQFAVAAAVDPTVWGVDMGNFKCPTATAPVFIDNPGHVGDGKNVISTGHNHNGDKMDYGAPAAVLPPGWIVSTELQTFSYEVLARTYPKLGNQAGTLAEADIGWMTHLETACSPIPWDYRLAKLNPADPDEPVCPEPSSYDYYSVILHEMGHVLGLGHLVDPQGQITDNVMQPNGTKGVRARITKLETDCLKQLYCNAATPAKKGSWGDLRRMYR